MTELWAILRDPRVSTTVALLAVLAGGAALIGLGYRSSAAIGQVSFQLPYVVSGGIVGLAVIGTALALLSIHVSRVEAAEERRLLARLQREVLRRVTEPVR